MIDPETNGADKQDALAERFRTAFESIDEGKPTPVIDVRRRARRRTQTRRSVLAACSLVAVVVVGFGAINLFSSSERTITVASPPVSVDELGASPNHRGLWTWQTVEEITTLTGEPSGYGMRVVDGRSEDTSETGNVANDLVIFLDDGGVCLDPQTCAHATESFDAETFESRFVNTGGGPAASLIGEGAPFETWDVVVVPGVTGDLHIGSRGKAVVDGVEGSRSLTGERNLEAVLAALAETRGNPRSVVLVGLGRSGLGAFVSTPIVHDEFGDRLQAVIAGGGVVLDSEVLPACVVRSWATTWGAWYPDDWDSTSTGESRHLVDIYVYLSTRFPNVEFAQLSGTDDPAMRSLYRTTQAECEAPAASATQQEFAAALSRLTGDIDALANLELFVADGSTSFPLGMMGSSDSEFYQWALETF